MAAQPFTMNRILIMRAGAVGDFILTLPVFEALRERWPSAEIEVAGHPEVACLAVDAGLADSVLRYDAPMWSALFVEEGGLPSALREKLAAQDAVISFTPDADGVMERRLRRACSGAVIVHPPKPASGHATEHLMGALACFGISAEARPARICLREERLAWGRQQLARRGIDAGRLVWIHPGSGGLRKCWPWERFEEAVHTLADARGAHVALSAGPADERLLPALTRAASGRVHRVAGLPLIELSAMLAHARCYIGNDSGITHLAAALGVPTVAIFGPTDPAVWAPRGEHVHVVHAPDLARLAAARVLSLPALPSPLMQSHRRTSG